MMIKIFVTLTAIQNYVSIALKSKTKGLLTFPYRFAYHTILFSLKTIIIFKYNFLHSSKRMFIAGPEVLFQLKQLNFYSSTFQHFNILAF
jgi:hypothetical protein